MAGRWISRSGPIARRPRSPDLNPLDFFLRSYVKNIVYQVKINYLQHLKPRVRDVVATATPYMLQATWNEVEYRLDICRVTMEPTLKFERVTHSGKTLIVSLCNCVTQNVYIK
jgi:hypothetical protein